MSEQPTTTHGLIASVSETAMRVLPPAMVLLIILNICFSAGLIYLVQANADYRNALLTKIVEGCLVGRQN
jgi:hypothetical protein